MHVYVGNGVIWPLETILHSNNCHSCRACEPWEFPSSDPHHTLSHYAYFGTHVRYRPLKLGVK